MKKYIKIMRLDHWIKQLFIIPGFVCLLFLGKYTFNLNVFRDLIIGLLATSLIASANYVINEHLDAKTDKYHPTKKTRAAVEQTLDSRIVYSLYIILLIAGLSIGYFLLNVKFFCLLSFLLIMGILYNVKPFRTKDVFIIDVLTESINNAIRLLLGWFIIDNTITIPISLVIGYWMTGAFLMSIKRYAEYRMINNKKVASNYRKSFKYYNEKILITISFFYAMVSIFLIGIFLIKYKIELLLFMPFLIGLYCYYFYLSFEKDSAVQKPEKLYKEKFLMLYCILLVLLFTVLINIHIEWLSIFN
jgi:4-hydroxybenzoate polyprenyltransferase